MSTTVCIRCGVNLASPFYYDKDDFGPYCGLPCAEGKLPTMKGNPRCSTCRFWKKVAWSSGECRRRAPVGVQREAQHPLSPLAPAWPETDDVSWCGEFKVSDEINCFCESPSRGECPRHGAWG